MAELVEGAAELERMLAQIGGRVAKKIVRTSVRSGQKVILARVKSNAGTMVGGSMGGKIAKNTKIKAPKRQKRGQYLLATRVMSDPAFEHENKDGKRHWIPAAIEFGHGQKKEQIAIPFMRRAADSEENNATSIVIKELGKGIEREAKLLAK
jgi:HK97 gp10 family phage protein